ncbi:MAG: bifunctional phosphopantothenoylcysteine decarboxylase/phosphopantothenate--cysteine ligase CoaBC [Cyanobacteria bacterium J083]|nr:MAG: bifunctional phosphopantothenoylcysteine decarboxylase/phosphopantothenate--cysteine ligase CoaBC [Cyanobacteria bacterium J083]
MLKNRRILIGIGGGIAAYKVCTLISQLFQLGAEVRVILTSTAQQFITPLTVATLSRHQAYTDQDFWQPIYQRPLHIELAEWADLYLIAPLTANTLGKLAHGLADNLLTNTVIASRCPILLAPAMNTEMWTSPTVQKNWQTILADKRYWTIEPGSGLLACDRIGIGRMAEPSTIVNAIECFFYSGGKRDLINKNILISAGGTREYLDPVRFLGNPSTGKMGVALALAAASRGARVTLVHGVMAENLLPHHPQIKLVPVVTAEEMATNLSNLFTQTDWLIMCAAVADVKPLNYYPDKIPKQELSLNLPLTPVPDIVAKLSKNKSSEQKIVGFAAQTHDIVPCAWDKLQRKKLDIIAANPVNQAEAGFASNFNQGFLLDSTGRQQTIESCSKLEFAHRLLDFTGQYP